MRFERSALTGFSALFLASAALAADVPGTRHSVSPTDLPKPYATPGVANTSSVVPRPPGTLPQAPKGFTVSVFASGLANPRWMALAPNGDVFLAEPSAGKITLLREAAGKVERYAFAEGLSRPHGLAFHDGALYVGADEAVWKLAYTNGATKAGAKTQVTKGGFGGKDYHWTRDIAVSPAGALFVAIGSGCNVCEEDPRRASVQRVKADGTLTPFATGTRNPVGIAFYPGTDHLFIAVNERDGLGDDLVPDYMTQIRQDDFLGWPYAYTGAHPDPDFGKKRPDLVAKTKTPDTLFTSHSAALGLAFYDATQFPAAYRGGAFVALHGSWNRGAPTGYKVVYVKFANGRPENAYEDFVTGFWSGAKTADGAARVWGRPAGLLVAKDGSLLIADDAGKTVWKVRYTGK